MFGNHEFLWGFILGLFTAQIIFLIVFALFAHHGRQAVIRYVERLEAKERKKRGLKKNGSN